MHYSTNSNNYITIVRNKIIPTSRADCRYFERNRSFIQKLPVSLIYHYVSIKIRLSRTYMSHFARIKAN